MVLRSPAVVGCLMKKWYAVFPDPSQVGVNEEELVEEWEHETEALWHFEAAAEAGELDGRKVIGMWILDDATEQGDVIKTWGRVSDKLRVRHNAYLMRQQ